MTAPALDVALLAKLEAGIGTILLSAASDGVARVYESLGLVRIGHAGLAEPDSQIALGDKTA